MAPAEKSSHTPRGSVLTRTTVAGYAIGSLGTGGFATLPGLVLVIYMTDVIIDPVIGAYSDRSLARTHSRRRFMVLGAILLPVFFVLTFVVPPGLGQWSSGVWVLIAFMAAATAFSLFQVPYIALPAELSDDYDQRTTLLTWRVVVLSFAILLFGAGGPALRALGGADEPLGYLLMAIVAGVVIGAGMLISSRVAPRYPQSVLVEAPRTSIRQNYAQSIQILKRSQPMRALLGTFMLQGLAVGVMLTGANFVAKYVLESTAALTFLFAALIAPALLCAPLWGLISARIGKERGYFIASALFAVALTSMIALVWMPGAWVYLPVALAGAGYAGMQSLPMAMLPDVITHDAATHGDGQAGAFGGVWTAGETTGMALGATAFTLVLAVTGYIESTGPGVMQPNSAITGISLSFSVLPAAIVALSLVTLRRYRLRKADIEALARDQPSVDAR